MTNCNENHGRIIGYHVMKQIGIDLYKPVTDHFLTTYQEAEAFRKDTQSKYPLYVMAQFNRE